MGESHKSDKGMHAHKDTPFFFLADYNSIEMCPQNLRSHRIGAESKKIFGEDIKTSREELKKNP
jgi:hypothetical protein